MSKDSAIDTIVKELRSEIAASRPDSLLPSSRELVARYRASAATIQKAIRRLAAEGLVIPMPGRGTIVAPPKPRRRLESADLSWQSLALGSGPQPGESLEALLALPQAGAIPLNSGFIDEALQPTSLLAAAAGRAARRPNAWDRTPVEGVSDLRSYFAAELGPTIAPHNVLVSPGGQAALAACFRGLAQPGDPVIVESPTYAGALAAARSAGLRLIPVPTDADGVLPDQLEDALRRSGARVVYCQPRHSNPSGSILAPVRRKAVLAAVSRAGAFLVEDDWVRDLDLDGISPGPLVDDDPEGHVIYIRSLTKSVAPGLRVAALVARGAALARLRVVRLTEDFFVAPLLQHTALEVLTAATWPKHLAGLRLELRRRRDTAVDAVAKLLPGCVITSPARGGFHLWVRLPDGADDHDVASRAAAAGVLVSAGSHWFPGEPPAPFFRISYAGAAVPLLQEGIRRLSEVLVP